MIWFTLLSSKVKPETLYPVGVAHLSLIGCDHKGHAGLLLAGLLWAMAGCGGVPTSQELTQDFQRLSQELATPAPQVTPTATPSVPVEFPVTVPPPVSAPSPPQGETLSPEQQVARQEFQSVALEQFFPESPVTGRDPQAIALAALGRTTLQEGEDPTRVEVLGTYHNYLAVLVTNFGQADDSVGGQRYRLEFTYWDNDHVILTWMGQQQYCRRSDPPAWSPDLCP